MVLLNTISVTACDCVCRSLCSFCAFVIPSSGNQWPAELTSVCAIDSFQNWQKACLWKVFQIIRDCTVLSSQPWGGDAGCLPDACSSRCASKLVLAIQTLFSSWFKFKVSTTPSKCSKWRDFFSPRHGAGLLKDAFQRIRTRSLHVTFQKARHYFANSFQ